MSANTVCLCGGEFSTQVLLVQHANDRGHLIRCSCHRLFGTHEALQTHQQNAHPQQTVTADVLSLFHPDPPPSLTATDHKCNLCHKRFIDDRCLAAHNQARHPPCPVCLQSFGTIFQLEGHQRAASHCYCAEHSTAFTSNAQLRAHLQSSLHVTGFECTSCDREFRSNRALSDHLNSDGHANVERALQARAATAAQVASARAQGALITSEEEADLWCDECNRSFGQLTALIQHKKSVKHNPLSDLRCPLSEQCTQCFRSPSALLFHLESGKCKSGMNRAKVNMLVHQHDTERHITSLANMRSVTTAGAATAQHLDFAEEMTARLDALSLGRGSFGRLMDVSETTSNNDNGVPIFTPSTSVYGRSRRTSVASGATSRQFGRVTDVSETTSNNDNGVPIFTPSTSVYGHSRHTSVAGDTTPRHAPNEWDFVAENVRFMPAQHGSSEARTVVSISTERQDWHCPHPSCEKVFKQQHSLIEHLESAAHAPTLYRCPTGLGLRKAHSKSFKTMSGVLQHLEAGACAGGTEALDRIFAMVEEKITDATGARVKLLRDGRA